MDIIFVPLKVFSKVATRANLRERVNNGIRILSFDKGV